MTRWSGYSLKLLVAASITATCLGAAEFVYRQLGHLPRSVDLNPNFGDDDFGWAAPDELLGWKNREGSFASTEPGEARMTFSNQGKRFDNLERESGSRTLVIGCSYSQGYAVNDRGTFAHFMNYSMEGRVSNYGVGGYGALQSSMMLERLLAKLDAPPERVIYGLIADHTNRDTAAPIWIRNLTTQSGLYLVPPHLRRVNGEWKQHGFDVVPLWPLENWSALVSGIHDMAIQFRYSPDPAEAIDASIHAIRRMRKLAEGAGSRLTVVWLADRYDRLEQALQTANIEFMDCRHRSFRKDENLQTFLPYGHPTARMHSLWAQCILHKLADQD